MAHVKKWQQLNRETIYHKYSQTIERRDYRLPNGETADFYIRIEDPGACALALTVENQVITIPQYRPGPDVIFRELPGGKVDKGEDPYQAGKRELLEETGYAGNAEAWIGTWQNDAYSFMIRSVIIIKNCRRITEPKLEETEFGQVELVNIPDFVSQARAGQLTDTAGAMLALDHLGLLA